MLESDQLQLAGDLLQLFAKHGLKVAVGLTHTGVAIRSQDHRMDATNIGKIHTYGESSTEAPRPNLDMGPGTPGPHIGTDDGGDLC